jgi:uncharacterized protein (DUF1800 family)
MPRTINRSRRLAFAAVASLVLFYTGSPDAQRASAVPQDADARTVIHVLNRIGFGPRAGDVARIQAMGLAAYIEQQLSPKRIDDAAVESRLSGFETLTMSTSALAETYFIPAQQAQRARQQQQRAQAQAGTDMTMMPPAPTPQATRVGQQNVLNELMQAKLLRGVMSERQLEEVLVDFWFNHFNVFVGKGQVRQYLTEYERDAIRPYVLGSFRDMLGATAHSPAMLFYLDNFQSQAPEGAAVLAAQGTDRARLGGRGQIGRMQPQRPGQRPVRVQPPPIITGRGRPNPLAGQPQPPNPQPQRRVRGLNENYARELMELHTLGVDAGYTQQDVIEVARILTGWTIDRPQQGGGFVFRPQVHDAGVKTVLGVKFGEGHGEDEGERLLDLLATHPATAKHIAYKLAQRFVSDEPPQSLVDRAAKVFLDTKGDLREVTRTIVTSPEFFAVDVYRAKVKTPFEFVISAARASNATVVNAQPMVQAMRELGMPLYGAQPPTGYSMTADAWVNTGALLNRMNFALQLVGGGQAVRPNQGVGGAPNRPNAVARAGQQQTRANVQGRGRQGGPGRGPLQVDIAALAPDTGQASRDRLIDQVLAGDASDATRATLARAETPQQLVALALGAPEFQRR